MSDDIYQDDAFLDEIKETIERYTLQPKDNDRESLANAIPSIQDALKQSDLAPVDKKQKTRLRSLLTFFRDGYQRLIDSHFVRKYFNEETATIIADAVFPELRESRKEYHKTQGVILDNKIKRRQLENGIRSSDEEVQITALDADAKTSETGTPATVPPTPHYITPPPQKKYLSTSEMSPEEIVEHLNGFIAYYIIGRDSVLRIVVSKVEQIQ